MRTRKSWRLAAVLLIIICASLFASCGNGGTNGGHNKNAATETAPPTLLGQEPTSVEVPKYATGFRIYSYESGDYIIRVFGGDDSDADTDYLLFSGGADDAANTTDATVSRDAADGATTPENAVTTTAKTVIPITAPAEKIYLAATAAMSLCDACGALDNGAIRFSSTQESGWYVENAAAKMAAGEIVFAGKYSEPDYELLLDGECGLAVESTMIYHTPEVAEKLESLGIPVFVDRSSYESDPLGRTEWVKVYGVLTGTKEQADLFFDKQEQIFLALKHTLTETSENENKPTVAFFFLNSAGAVVTRRTDDYIPQMIETAGGTYIFSEENKLEGSSPESKSGSVTMSFEEFYAAARDADILLYNGTIDNPLRSIDELLEKNAVFGEFAAVQNGNVYTTDRSLYQATDASAAIMTEMHEIFAGKFDAAGDAKFFRKVP